MADDDPLKRYLEMGASVLGISRERAEAMIRDLVASGEVARGQASKAADWLVERGRAGTEELTEIVRREINQQVAALGLATKDDLAELEARLEARAGAAGAASPPVKRAARARKAAAAKKVSAEKVSAKKVSARKGPARKGVGAAKAAGATKAAAARKPAGPPSAGRAAPPKG